MTDFKTSFSSNFSNFYCFLTNYVSWHTTCYLLRQIAPVSEQSMEIMSNQFGKISFEPEIIITFPNGVFGFENLKNYIIVDDEETEPFRWLMSVEESEVCFPILDPFLINSSYSDSLPKSVARDTTDPESSILIMGIVTLRNKNDKMTINLKGPLIINLIENIGKQIILNDESIDTAHPLN